MGRVEREVLGEQELTKLFVALSLSEARRVEAALDAKDVSYVVTVEGLGRTLLGSVRNCAVFSVKTDEAPHCARILTDAGFEHGLLIE